MITADKALDRCAHERIRSHPLELIPLFRRWPSSPLRNMLYTAIWSSLIALGLTIMQAVFGRPGMSLARVLFFTLVISNMIGFAVHGALQLIELAVRREHVWLFRSAQLLAVGAVSVVGIPLGNAILLGRNPLDFFHYSDAWRILLVFGIMTAVLMVLVLVAGERRLRREAQAARQQEQIAAAGRLIAEARLRALQAQIEPHFLYNTLANVVSLIDRQPARARRMLERFIDYLRASLAASRAEHATLQGELDLAAAYLDVLGVRMESRLHWRFEADPAAGALPVAPMLLQPLVENAIIHGIEPKLEGGEIVVRARLEDGLLCLEVRDTGLGLRPAPPRPGGGVGLSNLRERLRQLYGAAAQLQLIENPAGGVTSRLLLPLMVPSSTTHMP